MSVLWDKIGALEVKLRQVEAERDELRAAVRAFLGSMEDEDGDSTIERCSEEGCHRLAMYGVAWTMCDRHAGGEGIEIGYAAPLRALRALLGGAA